MKRVLVAVVLAGCVAAPGDSLEKVRQFVPGGAEADGIRAEWGVLLYGPWVDSELRPLKRALSAYPGKDLTGFEFYRLPASEGDGARYDDGKIRVYDPLVDVLIHEIAHGTHARCFGHQELNAKLAATVDFREYHRTLSWVDGTIRPRHGYVTPYAARNVYELVAESITAAKLHAWFSRGPLRDVDWSEPRFERVFELLDDHGLLGEPERKGIEDLKKADR